MMHNYVHIFPSFSIYMWNNYNQKLMNTVEFFFFKLLDDKIPIVVAKLFSLFYPSGKVSLKLVNSIIIIV